MTLARDVYDHFDRLELWFEPTVTLSRFLFPHTYGPLPGYSQLVQSMHNHSRLALRARHSKERRVHNCTTRPPPSITEISGDPCNLLPRSAHVWRSDLFPQHG